jgi:2',3'-cyclic-nucleotide 2'-phosphodiesterase (5'-nucleotidase family)
MVFQLQLLHAADQEAAIPALLDAPNFSGVLNALADDFENTLILSSGDAFIPGVFFSASADVYGGEGRADILIQNELGFQAIAFGNHEFDRGTARVRDLILGDGTFTGTAFPYLSANLDFSTDANLADLVVADGQAPQANSIAASTVIDVNGEKIGVVGATTPTIPVISSPGDVTVNPQPFDGNPTSDQLDALAAEIQADVDALLASNPEINKVVLLAHMQQIAIEQELASRLSHVDIIVAGGSNTRLVDETDRLRDGDTAQGVYPIIQTGADGNPVAVVNTDGNYKYVGRLVIDFDDNGVLLPESYDSAISGAYATDAQGVADLNAAGLIDPEIQAIVDALEQVIVAQDGNFFGVTDVFLNGTRASVRTEETNLGNLTADANLAIAQEYDSDVVISIKNGGGIRNNIGEVVVPAGATEPVFAPPAGNALAGRPEGGISQTAIQNALSFNNELSLLTVTAAELKAIIQHGIDASGPGLTQGRFPQVSGVEFDYIDTDPTTPGYELLNLNVVDGDGNTLAEIVKNGELVADPAQTFRLVTLNFLAGGGDGYPFPQDASANRVDLVTEALPAGAADVASFAAAGSEQDALAEYLAANFSEANPFSAAETPIAEDTRIRNALFSNTVIQGSGTVEGSDSADVIIGSELADTLAGLLGDDYIVGGDDDDVLRGDLNKRDAQVGIGNDDIIYGGAGNDRIGGKGGNDQLFGESGDDAIWGDDGDDLIRGGLGNDRLTGDDFSGGSGSDTFVLSALDGKATVDGVEIFYTDTIVDFEVGVDVIGLADGLTQADLTFDGSAIKLDGQVLAILQGVADAAGVDFTTV